MGKKQKYNGGIVYSTDPDFSCRQKNHNIPETLPPEKQSLGIRLDRRNRAGKTVTLVTGFIGTVEDLDQLGKELKQLCGAGGTVKDGQIIIQGDFQKRIMGYLSSKNFRVVKSGG